MSRYRVLVIALVFAAGAGGLLWYGRRSHVEWLEPLPAGYLCFVGGTRTRVVMHSASARRAEYRTVSRVYVAPGSVGPEREVVSPLPGSCIETFVGLDAGYLYLCTGPADPKQAGPASGRGAGVYGLCRTPLAGGAVEVVATGISCAPRRITRCGKWLCWGAWTEPKGPVPPALRGDRDPYDMSLWAVPIAGGEARLLSVHRGVANTVFPVPLAARGNLLYWLVPPRNALPPLWPGASSPRVTSSLWSVNPDGGPAHRLLTIPGWAASAWGTADGLGFSSTTGIEAGTHPPRYAYDEYCYRLPDGRLTAWKSCSSVTGGAGMPVWQGRYYWTGQPRQTQTGAAAASAAPPRPLYSADVDQPVPRTVLENRGSEQACALPQEFRADYGTLYALARDTQTGSTYLGRIAREGTRDRLARLVDLPGGYTWSLLQYDAPYWYLRATPLPVTGSRALGLLGRPDPGRSQPMLCRVRVP